MCGRGAIAPPKKMYNAKFHSLLETEKGSTRKNVDLTNTLATLNIVPRAPLWLKSNTLARYSTTLRTRDCSVDKASTLLQLRSTGRNLTLLSKNRSRSQTNKKSNYDWRVVNCIRYTSDVLPLTSPPSLDTIIRCQVYK